MPRAARIPPAASARVLAVSAAAELRTRWRERTVLLAALVVAIALPLLLDLAIGRGAGADYRPRIGVVVPADDAVATSVRDALADRRDLRLDLRTFVGTPAARAALRAGRVDAALVLPAGLADLATAAGPPRVVAIVGSAAPLAGQVASGLARAVQDRIDATWAASRSGSAEAARPPATADVLRALALAGVDLHLVDLEDPPASPLAYFGPSITILMAVFLCGAAARGLADERATGVAERWAALPCRWWVHDVGVACGASLTALGVSLLSWAVCTLGFGVSWGPPAAVALLLAASAVAAVGIDLVVLRLAGRSGNRIDGASSAVLLLVGLLGGHIVPLSQLPGWLRAVGAAVPTGWAVRAFADLVQLHAPASAAIAPAALVAGLGVAGAALSLRRPVASRV